MLRITILTLWLSVSVAIERRENLQSLTEFYSSISLAECAAQVVRRYFPVSQGITYTDLTPWSSSLIQTRLCYLLVKLLAKNYSWTIHRKSRAIISFDKHVEKTENYVLRLRNPLKFMENIIRIKENPSWNPHARFLVISATHFKESGNVAQKLAEVLWKEKVMDGTILLRNSVNSTKYDVFTWYPYHNNNCGSNITVVKLDDWCVFGDIKNVSGKPWFGEKLPKQFNGCLVKTSYNNFPPFAINMKNNSYVYQKSRKIITTNGIEITMINTILQKLNLTGQYTTISNDPAWGNVFSNHSATGTLKLLMNGDVDIAIGDYGCTISRYMAFDASMSYMQESMRWAVPNLPERSYFGLLKIIHSDVIFLSIFTCIVLSFGVWCITLLWEVKSHQLFGQIILNTFLIMLGKPLLELPRSSILRYIVLLYMVYGYLLDSYYITFLTSILTHPIYKQKYATISDILRSNIKLYVVPNSMQHLVDYKPNLTGKVTLCSNFTECLLHTASEGHSAMLLQTSFMKYSFRTRDDLKRTLYVHKERMIAHFPICFYMRKGFPLYGKFYNVVGQVFDTGILNKWKSDVMYPFPDMENNAMEFLNFQDFIPVFMILCYGYLLAAISFICELVIPKTKNYFKNFLLKL